MRVLVVFESFGGFRGFWGFLEGFKEIFGYFKKFLKGFRGILGRFWADFGVFWGGFQRNSESCWRILISLKWVAVCKWSFGGWWRS